MSEPEEGVAYPIDTEARKRRAESIEAGQHLVRTYGLGLGCCTMEEFTESVERRGIKVAARIDLSDRIRVWITQDSQGTIGLAAWDPENCY